MTNAPQTEAPTTALARVEDEQDEGLAMVVAPTIALQRLNQLQAFIKEVMVKGEDFGVIPGTQKPTLLQPGAQKLAEIYGLVPHYEPIDCVKDWKATPPFFHFEYRCVLTRKRDGGAVSEGLGSCNSRESRYAYRWVFPNELPKGASLAALKSKTGKSRKTGKPYTQYRLDNDDTPSLVNTIQKMAVKRAFVAAVISATRSSGIFTQDVEDMPREILGGREDESEEQPPPPPEEPKKSPHFILREAELTAAQTKEQLLKLVPLIKADLEAKKLTPAEGRALGKLGRERRTIITRSDELAPPDDDFPESYHEAPSPTAPAPSVTQESPPKPMRQPGED